MSKNDVRTLTLPDIRRGDKPTPRALGIPWIVRSLLHSQGVDTATLKISAFLELAKSELDSLAAHLLHGLSDVRLRSAVSAFVDELRVSSTSSAQAR